MQFLTPSNVDACPFREVRSDGRFAACGLLKRLAGDLPVDATVDVDACTACVECGPAESGHVNPVVASLLWTRTGSELASRLQDPLMDVLRRQLSRFAERHLATLDGDSCGDVVPPAPDNFAGQADAPVPRSSFHFPIRKRPIVIGLVGWNTRTGLGYQNRDVARHLPVDRWLIPVDGAHRSDVSSELRCRSLVVSCSAASTHLNGWLSGLDWLLFVETEYVPGLAERARQRGVRVACVPNHEALCVGRCDWLHFVDLMLCPTRYTLQFVNRLRHQFGFAWRTELVPWPIDVRRFRFRLRSECRRFIFVHGTGGMRGVAPDGELTQFHRKGLELMMDAAHLVPHIPVTVYSQRNDLGNVPPGVTVVSNTLDNRSLFDDGDVCVQPSHWEGLGLPHLECQAAGLPLITTDAPPMSEHQPLARIPVEARRVVTVCGDQPVIANLMNPTSLADVMHSLYGTSIARASRSARRFVTREHSWKNARRRILNLMGARG